jgi:hypothetical protein
MALLLMSTLRAANSKTNEMAESDGLFLSIGVLKRKIIPAIVGILIWNYHQINKVRDTYLQIPEFPINLRISM